MAGLEIVLVLGIVVVAAYLFIQNGGIEGLGLAPPVAEGAEEDPETPPDEVQEAVDTSGEEIPDDDQLLDPQPIFVGVPEPYPVPYFIYDDRDDNRREKCKCRKYDKRRMKCEARRRKGRCICECKRRHKRRVIRAPPRFPDRRRPPWPKPVPTPIPTRPRPRWPPSNQVNDKTVPTTPKEEEQKNKMAGFLMGDALYSQPGIIRFSGVG